MPPPELIKNVGLTDSVLLQAIPIRAAADGGTFPYMRPPAAAAIHTVACQQQRLLGAGYGSGVAEPPSDGASPDQTVGHPVGIAHDVAVWLSFERQSNEPNRDGDFIAISRHFHMLNNGVAVLCGLPKREFADVLAAERNGLMGLDVNLKTKVNVRYEARDAKSGIRSRRQLGCDEAGVM